MKNLLKAIHAVMGEVDYVQKTEKNQYQGYSYANELALLSNLRPALLKHGLVICPSLDSVGDWCDTNGNTHIVMCFTIYHVETGENLSCRIPAAGNDLYRSGKVGDKGIYSALTGATKYFLFKTFLLPTGDDPESRKETDVAGNEKKEAPKTNINLADHANGSAPVKDKQAFNEWADEFLSFIKEMKANNDIDGAMKNAKATLTLIKSRFPDIYDRVEIGVKHHRSKLINNVTLDGRVGKDPVCGESSSGTKYAQFSIAHNVYDRGKQSTYWIRCVAFGKMADTIEDYVLKGMAVVVAGDLRISPGREGSQEVGVIVKQLQMQSKPKSTRPEPEKKEGDPFEDDIPF